MSEIPRILVVEDDPERMKSLAQQLAEGGFEPRTVSSLEEARDLPTEADLDLVLASRREVFAPFQTERTLTRLAELNSDFLFACRHKDTAYLEREWTSEAFFRITGFTPEDLEAAGCWLFCVHPEDRPSVDLAFSELHPGFARTLEFRILNREGQTRWVSCSVEIETAGDGSHRRIGAVKDITDRVATERALSMSRAELYAVYDQAPVMLTVLNFDRRVLFANQAFLAFTGKTEESTLARRVCATLGCPVAQEAPSQCGTAPECLACPLMKALTHTAETGEACRSVERWMSVQHGNERREVVLLGATCRLDHPISPKLLLTLQDITELKQAEIAQRAVEQQYRAIFEVSPTAIFLLKEGRYIFANPAAARMLGYERPEDLLGRPIEDTVPRLHLDQVRARMARNQEGQPNPPLEMQVIRRDGSMIEVESMSVPLHLPGGMVTLIQSHDISERKRSELQQRTRALLSEAAQSLDYRSLVHRALDWLRELADSPIGFLHLVDLHETLVSPSTFAACCPLGPSAAWAAALGREDATIHNAPPAQESWPEGCPPIQRELLIPIRRGGGSLALMGLGNKATPYTPSDLQRIQQAALLAWEILEGKRRDEALFEREQRLQRLSEATEIGLVIHEQGRILEVSDAMLRIFGHDHPSAVTGRMLTSYVHPDDLPLVLARMQEGGSCVYEVRCLRANGESFPARVHARATNWNGRPVRVASIQDLSTLHHLEEQLELREQRLTALLHNLPGVVFQWRVQPGGVTRLEYLSSRARELFGPQEDPFREDWSLAEHLHPEDRPAFEEGLAEAIRLRQTWHFEGRLLRSEDDIRWIHLQSYPVVDGPDLVFHGLVLDTTEHMEAMAALVESEARFRTLFDTHNAVFLLVDPSDGAIVDANASARSYYGYTAEEITRLHVSDLNVLSMEEIARERRKALRRERNYFIFPHRMKDGTVRTVEVHSSPVTIRGRLLLFSIVHDVTERILVEDALRQSEQRFRLLLDASNDAVFLHGFREDGIQGTFLDVSRTAYMWLGYTREELLELRPADIVGEGEREQMPGIAKRLLQQGSLVFTQTLVTKEGRPIQAELSSQIVEVDRRELVLTIARDVSERNRAQALATATESILAKGRMAAYIAHEINSPLAGIKNAFMLVSDAIPPEHRFYRYVGMIHQEISRISNIVKTMYELYKPTSQTSTDLLVETVLQDVATLLAPKVRSHQAELSLDLPDPTLRATLPSDLLRQVLFNLLQNALEASPPKGIVCCRATREQDRLCLQVIDEGPGIAPDLAPRIFEPGFSTKHGLGTQMGLGLGLGSARKLAEGMGGTLTFANHADRRGCTFTLDLPLTHQGIHSE